MNQPSPLDQSIQLLDRALQPPEGRAPFTRADYTAMDTALRTVCGHIEELTTRAEAAEAKLAEIQAKPARRKPAPPAK
jgi:hypothetical protein